MKENIVRTNLKLLRLNEVCELTSLKKSTLFKHIKLKRFPLPFKLLGKVNAFDEQEILNWIKDQRSAS